MPTDDRAYFLRRAREEEAAIRAATNMAARGRHEEMASSYRMRVVYLDHDVSVEPPLDIALCDEPFVAKSEAVGKSPEAPHNRILVR